jgi:four helix bundle protein
MNNMKKIDGLGSNGMEFKEFSDKISAKLLEVADEIEREDFFLLARIVRSASIVISRGISESLKSNSSEEFLRFIGLAQSTIFEIVRVLIVLYDRNPQKGENFIFLLDDVEYIWREISNIKTRFVLNEKHQDEIMKCSLGVS